MTCGCDRAYLVWRRCEHHAGRLRIDVHGERDAGAGREHADNLAAARSTSSTVTGAEKDFDSSYTLDEPLRTEVVGAMGTRDVVLG